MILSDTDLLARLEEGDLVVDPLDDPDLQVQPASIDVRLGREFLEFQRTNISCIHPNDEREVEEYVSETHVEEGAEFILHPGDFVLGTTKERVEVPPDLVAQVEGRSSLGRLAVVVHASLPADEELFLWTAEEGFGFHEIGDVVENEMDARAVSFDPNSLRVRTHDVTDFITNPAKRIYRVTLESGREVRVTRDHNVFTLDEWGEVTRVASEDAVGEHVMVPGTLPGPRGEETEVDLLTLFDGDDEDIAVYAADGLGTADRTDVSDATLPRYLDVTAEFGWVLGFYVADGDARREQMVFTNTSEAYLQRVADWFDGSDASLSWGQTSDGVEQLTVRSAPWSRVFRSLAGAGSEKRLPERAWNWSDEVLEGLLDGLLDGGGRRREERDTLYTTNEELADRATYLGARLGYATSTSRREGDGEENRDEWSVDFYEDAHAGQDVPTPSELLRSLREEAGLTVAKAAGAADRLSASGVSNLESGADETVTRGTLRALREWYADHGADVSRLDDVLAEHVRFDRVVSVEETDRVETTYDLEVQPNGKKIENFLGGFGGVFLSNTAGFIDPGFEGRITLELSNLGSAPVALTPGMRISQLVFTELASPATRPYGEERGSKYQGQTGPQASRIRGDTEFGGEQ